MKAKADPRTVLLLTGSPKPPEVSSSAKVGRRLLGRLEAAGWSCRHEHLHEIVQGAEEMGRWSSVMDTDLVVLAVPLYVDGFPGPVIHALQQIAACATHPRNVALPRVFSVILCGFVEPQQADTAQKMAEAFCLRAGFGWAGELSLGGGGMMNRRLRSAVDQIGDALAEERTIPERAQQVARRPILPAWLYGMVGNAMWKRAARAHGVKRRIHDRPYESR
jgi:hypothetical protein